MMASEIGLKNGPGLAVRLQMNNAALLVIRAAKGFVMCGYLNVAVADRLGDAACVVTGVDSFEDVLRAPIVDVSENARRLGIIKGMSGREALDILS